MTLGAVALGQEFPGKPIKVVVPFGPGGASDTMARIIQEGLRRNEAAAGSLVIVNVPGVGGSIGSRRVKNARPDGYTLLNLHDGILTAKYAGKTTYAAEAFVPIASTGAARTMVCVGPDAPWTSLPELLEAAKAAPGTLTFGGNLGAPSHFAGLLLEHQLPGATFKVVDLGGGADRFANLAGGHVDVSVFSASEYGDFRRTPERANGLIGLAYLSEERHSSFDEVPTAREQDIDLVSGITQYWWAPLGTPPERVEALADLLESAMQSDFVQTRYADLGVVPTCLRGEGLRQSIASADAQLAALDLDTQTATVRLHLVPILAGASLLFGLLSLLMHRRSKAESAAASSNWTRAICLLGGLAVYTLLMSFAVAPYWLLTLLFASGVGLLLAPDTRARLFSVGLALVLGFGLEFLFKTIFFIDLP